MSASASLRGAEVTIAQRLAPSARERFAGARNRRAVFAYQRTEEIETDARIGKLHGISAFLRT